MIRVDKFKDKYSLAINKKEVKYLKRIVNGAVSYLDKFLQANKYLKDTLKPQKIKKYIDDIKYYASKLRIKRLQEDVGEKTKNILDQETDFLK